jgi:hypothetical protein
MIPSEYILFEKAGTLVVEWMEPPFPAEIKVLAVGLLALMPFLFYFRSPIARFADRYLHIHGSPKTVGLLAPALSLLCGVTLFFVREPRRIILWDLETFGISVKTPHERGSLFWKDVSAAAYDTKPPTHETLVLSSKDNQSVRLDLSMVEPTHQEKIIDFINRSTANRFHLTSVPDSPDESEENDLFSAPDPSTAKPRRATPNQPK